MNLSPPLWWGETRHTPARDAEKRPDAIALYALQMWEMKHRLEVVDYFPVGGGNALYEPTTIEPPRRHDYPEAPEVLHRHAGHAQPYRRQFLIG